MKSLFEYPLYFRGLLFKLNGQTILSIVAQTREGAIKTAAKLLGISTKEYYRRIAVGLKHCTKCKQWKSVADFGKDSHRSDGLKASCFACNRVSVRVSTKGRVSTFKGRKHTPESLQKLSDSLKGRISKFRGVPRTEEVRAKVSRSRRASNKVPRGESHYAYKDGASKRRTESRRSPEYLDWRKAIFERDKYTCQKCGDSKGGNLNAHHIKPFAHYPELRLDISNGITLCEPCHEAAHYKPDSIRNKRKQVV